ncbi:MipA/OmpV family protein [Mesorhizobium sp. VNQ89]|uniref:MipA/OmpV family protein n=1 Tax=Mesorhizobium quangtriensis TaxID=3157709 RepID=UPI0032B71C57
MLRKKPSLLAASLLLALPNISLAGEGGGVFDWVHGDWKLIVGATGMVAPDFEGAKDLIFSVSPIISLGKAGPEARFTSRNDGISISLYDNGSVRAGLNGQFIRERDSNDYWQLQGLDPVRWGGEIGGFAEVYPTDWLRLRGEVRHGVRSHTGVVADITVDAFNDITDSVRISGGPRMSWASADYFESYYGVDAAESAASGLSEYDPGGGLKSIGFGGAYDWKATEKLTTSVFAEYSRLMGPAADSSLVEQRGSPNQFTFGLSAAYRFDFSM